MAAGEVRIEIDGLPEELLRYRVVTAGGLAQMPEAALIGSPGIKATRRLAHRAHPLGLGNGRRKCGGQCLRDFVLHGKNVRKMAVIALGPDMVRRTRLDELRRYAN